MVRSHTSFLTWQYHGHKSVPGQKMPLPQPVIGLGNATVTNQSLTRKCHVHKPVTDQETPLLQTSHCPGNVTVTNQSLTVTNQSLDQAMPQSQTSH